jgi:macrolide phosphotransferase
MKNQEIFNLAANHGLQLLDEMAFNEMGIDFKVGFAKSPDGTSWVLRIPRRRDLWEQIEQESKILSIARKYLSVAVPDWKIAGPKLVAYPLLEDPPIITFDEITYEVTWHMEKNNPKFVPSLAENLVKLHQIPTSEAESLGLKSLPPQLQRQEVSDRIDLVKREVGIGAALEKRWREWLDNDKLWPDFSAFIHGDLYAGHILAAESGEISGIIDWSEGQVSDPSIDFSGHVSVFGEDSLRELLTEYEKLGGKVWEGMFDQILERNSASPLNYAAFAITTRSEEHLKAAKTQLGIA